MIKELIIGQASDYILLFILGLLPLMYKFSFWLYTIQLKEYRGDRFKEYLGTKQGKSALFNIWFVVEICLLIFSLFILGLYFTDNIYTTAFFGLFYKVFFWFLIIENIFVFGKIFRRNILKPKITSRLLILSILIFVGLSLDLYFFIKLNLFNYVYLYILLIFLLVPAIIFLFNFISLPLVNYKKNKIINSAIKKSKEINNPIKIGITGSYGKSSVKEYLSQILEQEGNTLKTPNNINTELGVGTVILNKLNDKFKYFVAEMGAYKIGEIKTLGKIVNHKYAFLTAIGNQHLGLFGSIGKTKTAKFEILDKVIENNGILYVNFDNENIRNYLSENKIDNKYIIKYGVNSDNLDAKSKILEISNGQTVFEFKYKKIKETFQTNLLGEHNIINLTGILAFCIDQKIPIVNLKKYLLELNGPKNTLEILPPSNFPLLGGRIATNITLINDTYNLSEEGLLAGINVLNSFDGEKILVMDDILELGNDAENIHKLLGQKIAKEHLVDKVLFCGVNYSKSFIQGLIKGDFNKNNIIYNLDNINTNCIVLFEGRNAKKYFDKIK